MSRPSQLSHPLRRAVWWIEDYLYAGWRQLAALALPWTIVRARPLPPTWDAGSDALPDVVLVPGVYEHWTFLRPLGRALNRAGHRVRVVHGLGVNRRTIPDTAERLRAVLAETPSPPAGRILVAHSKGGLIGKHVLVSQERDAAARGAASPDVVGLVAVCTPFAGSRRARLLLAPSIRIFLPTDATIVELGSQIGVNARIVSVFGPYDPHIPEGSALDGAMNVEVPTPGHFRPLGAPSTHRAVIEAIAHLTGTATDDPRA